MTTGFQPAKKYQSRLRLGLAGPTGSGKTYSALAIASGLGAKIALIDTEHASASLYADRFAFDTLNLSDFDPRNYMEAITAAEGYDVLVIDSLSHAWAGKGGALEMVDKARARSQSNNSFTAWKDITPLQNRLVDAILGAPMHVIATLRSKTEYVIETVNGKAQPRKIGLAPVQRDSIEYEFTVFGEMNAEHQLVVTKSRLAELSDQVIDRPGAPLAAQLLAWLSGEPAPEPAPAPPPAAPQNGTGPDMATQAQTKTLHTLASKIRAESVEEWEQAAHGLYVDYPAAHDADGKMHFSRLTRAEASRTIDKFNQLVKVTA